MDEVIGYAFKVTTEAKNGLGYMLHLLQNIHYLCTYPTPPQKYCHM
jgi:hypothetical protein